MKHAFIFFFAFLFSVLSSAPEKGSAQVNIEPNLVMPANPSPYLSDWQSQAGSIRLTAVLEQPFNQPVKLMAQVSLGGQPVARTKPEKMPMLSLHQGLNSFNAADIIPYQAVSFLGGIDQSAQRAGRLPEGNYEICVWFINPETGAPLANSPCRPFTIRDVQPPMLISPANGATFARPSTIPIELVSLSLQSCQPITINDLAKLDGKSIATMKAFDLVSGNTHSLYVQTPRNTGTDSKATCACGCGGTAQPGCAHKGCSCAGMAISPENNMQTNSTSDGGSVYHFSRLNASANSVSDIMQTFSTLQFQWLPPMPTLTSPVQYKLRIVQILPGQNPIGALNTAMPVIEKTVNAPFYAVQYLSDEYFKLGETGVHSSLRQFAWGVQALDASGNPIGKNNGWSEPRTFTVGDLMMQPLGNEIPKNSFFDIFVNIELPKEPCGKHAVLIDTKFGPWRLAKSYSQYYNVWTRNVYNLYRVIDCGLEKGHAGPHHGSSTTCYVLDHVEKSDQHGIDPPPPTPPASMGDEPPKKDQMSKEDMQKILDKDNAPKDAGNGGKDGGNNGGDKGNGQGGKDNGNGSGSGTDNSDGSKGTGTGGTGGPGVKISGQPEEQGPCPYIEKTLLRTVAGSWRLKKDSKKTHGVSLHPTGGSWAGTDAVWERDIWNVFSVRHCTLLKGHGGAHKLDGGSEEFEKKITITAAAHYNVGEDQVPPKDSSDGLPQEDPPKK